MEEKHLEHHGILGMKWGVRRTPEQLGHKGGDGGEGGEQKSGFLSRLAEKRAAKAEMKARERADVKMMTDDDLRSRVNRLNMEEQYTNLVAREKERNRGYLSKALEKGLTTLGDTLVTGLGKYAANSMLEMMGIDPKGRKISDDEKKKKGDDDDDDVKKESKPKKEKKQKESKVKSVTPEKSTEAAGVKAKKWEKSTVSSSFDREAWLKFRDGPERKRENNSWAKGLIIDGRRIK